MFNKKEIQLIKECMYKAPYVGDERYGTFKVIQKKLDELEDSENKPECEHVFGEYVGKKTCCTKCGAYEEGMGFEWSLVEDSK